jgi:D-sedoheptulose 7-phosphate isomerase
MPDAAQALAIVQQALDGAAALHQRVRAQGLEPVVKAAQEIATACAAGGKVLIFGNGGSAADAQHFAAELVGRFEKKDRAPLAAIALTTDTSVMTAVANDLRFDRVFSRQVEALGRPGDVAVGISTSGASTNVVVALRTARERGLKTVALTGHRGGECGRMAEIHINVPDDSAARVQEVHRTLIHALCRIVESGGGGDERSGIGE